MDFEFSLKITVLIVKDFSGNTGKSEILKFKMQVSSGIRIWELKNLLLEQSKNRKVEYKYVMPYINLIEKQLMKKGFTRRDLKSLEFC